MMPMNLVGAPPSPPLRSRAGRGGVRLFRSLAVTGWTHRRHDHLLVRRKSRELVGQPPSKYPPASSNSTACMLRAFRPTLRLRFPGTTLLPIRHTHAKANLICLEQQPQTNVSRVKTTIKCAAWASEKFSPKITFLFPGINLGRAQSGQQTNSKLMKNKPNEVTEVRHLSAKAEHSHHHIGDDGVDRRGFLKCMAWAGSGML